MTAGILARKPEPMMMEEDLSRSSKHSGCSIVSNIVRNVRSGLLLGAVRNQEVKLTVLRSMPKPTRPNLASTSPLSKVIWEARSSWDSDILGLGRIL